MLNTDSGVARGVFNCCKHCVPPKRHVGCHACCKEYIAAKNKHETQKHDAKVESEADRWL